MNQKSIKGLKKEIVRESALEVGYYEGTREAIMIAAPDILEKVMASDVAGYLTKLATNNDIGFDNLFVSEAVRLMSYSEFKQVAHKFFGYTRTNEEILAEPITLSRAAYENLQERAENNFMNKTTSKATSTKSLEIQAENEPVAYNPLTEEIAYMVSDSSNAVPYFDENLISNYKSEQPELSLILAKIKSHVEPDLYQQIHSFLQGMDPMVASKDPVFMETFVELANQVLSVNDQQIIQHTAQDQVTNESWQLHYFFDQNTMPGIEQDEVINYLEHEVAAYYRGSLSELRIFDKDDVEVESYLVDRDTFVGNEISQVKSYTQNDNYVDLATGFKLQNLGVEITPEVLNDFLNAEPKQTNLKK